MARQEETELQNKIVQYVNLTKCLNSRVFRIKTGGTYDPTLGIFRSNTTEKGIPDIIGCRGDGRAIFIEVKLPRNHTPRFVSPHQKLLLQKMSSLGALVGIAYGIDDAHDIIMDDPTNFPRNIRTYNYETKPREKLTRPDGTRKTKKQRADPLRAIIEGGRPEAIAGQRSGPDEDSGA